MPLEFVKSQKNQDQLLHDGYVYTLNVRVSDRCNWRCVEYHRRKCTARVVTKDDRVVSETSRTHNHLPTTTAVPGQIYRGCRQPRQKAKTSVEMKYPISGAVDMTVVSLVQSMVNAIAMVIDSEGDVRESSLLPTVTLEADSFVFHEPQRDKESLYKPIVIYGTYTNLNRLEKTGKGDRCCWFLDSSQQLDYRILVIHAIDKTNAIVPAAYCLLPNDRRETYTTALQTVRNARPTNCPLQIPADSRGRGGILIDLTDEDQVEAFRHAFGDDVRQNLRCCFWHLTRSLWRIVDSNADLRAKYEDDKDFALNVRKLAALAFVPADRVVAAFDELVRSPSYVAHDPILAPLVDHFEDTWIGRPTRTATRRRTPRHPLGAWNCYDAVVQNDLAETLVSIDAWHRSFDAFVSTSRGRSVSEFVGRLQSEQVVSDVSNQRTTAAKLKQIVDSFKKFARVDQFLTVVAHCYRLQNNGSFI